MLKLNKKIRFSLLLLFYVPLLCPFSVSAHGEKALEPFIRMRTIQWYDLQWSDTQLRVNDQLEIEGKFHVAEDWPVNVPKPEATYLNISTPGPVLIRTERYLNGQPTLNSVELEQGGDYTFKMVLKARIPGHYHIHPFFNLRDAGAVVGPGIWVDVSGDASDFVNKVTLLNGQEIDMESYGLSNAIYWHGFWILAGTAWLLWWLRRPLFIQRYKLLQAGREDLLVTETDKTIGKAILAGVAVVVLIGYVQGQNKHPNNIPLQAARDQIEPLAPMVNTGAVHVLVKKATYHVTDRAMKMNLEIKNNSDANLRIGELAVANVRFLNAEVVTADGRSDPDLIAESGLSIDYAAAIQPGETRNLVVTAQDAAWQTQRLDGLIKDADSRMGGLLFFYDDNADRHVVSISSAVIPQYLNTVLALP